MVILRTSWDPFMVTFTLPCPEDPMISRVLSSAWSWFILDWRACAFCSMPAMSFIPSYRSFPGARPQHFAVEQLDDPVHQRRFDRGRERSWAGGSGLGPRAQRLSTGRNRGLAHQSGAPPVPALQLLVQDLTILFQLEHGAVKRVLARERDPHAGPGDSEETSLLQAGAQKELPLLHPVHRVSPPDDRIGIRGDLHGRRGLHETEGRVCEGGRG